MQLEVGRLPEKRRVRSPRQTDQGQRNWYHESSGFFGICSCADCSCRQEDHVHLVLRRRQRTVGVSDAVEGANRRRLLWLMENLTRDTTDGNVFL